MLQTVAMAARALRSAADDLTKTQGEIELNIGHSGKLICVDLVSREKIRFKDLGILAGLIAYELEKGNP